MTASALIDDGWRASFQSDEGPGPFELPGFPDIEETVEAWPTTWMVPLGNTFEKEGQGVAGWAQFHIRVAPARAVVSRRGTGFRVYPACSEHGAMNRVADIDEPQLWRCLNCNIGVEVHGRWS